MERDPRVDDLPESIRPVGEHLGYAAAATLVDAFPGYRLHIPKTLRPGHQLEALGDVAAPLCQHFGGETITVPKALMTAEARARRVRELRAQGLNANEIAGRVGATRRRVLDILDGKGGAPRSGRARPRDERHGSAFRCAVVGQSTSGSESCPLLRARWARFLIGVKRMRNVRLNA